MRLKLAGALVHKGSCWAVPWRAWDFAHCACAGGPVARSLSAIR
jgi:hypothetical protein